ncbi:MAG: nicotinate phosphoribosyltransferase, partial [Acidimicrobiaceae bacterium]|nr:nicotinate phosphoribosyltransferase [Acidimicrobiaceae bacterium]
NHLDSLGATAAQIMVSGDLDEYKIKKLSDCPIDAFESGHRLVTGSGAPSAGFVFKLVEIGDSSNALDHMRPVAKNSTGKESIGGKKHAKRLLSNDLIAQEEILTIGQDAFEIAPLPNERYLQTPLCTKGNFISDWTIENARDHFKKVIEEIPKDIRLRRDSPPAIPTKVIERL